MITDRLLKRSGFFGGGSTQGKLEMEEKIYQEAKDLVCEVLEVEPDELEDDTLDDEVLLSVDDNASRAFL